LVFLNPGGQVLAYHCCQADTPETLRPARFVRSIAAMIAGKLSEYAARLDDPTVQEALSVRRCEQDPASAFEEGVLTQLEYVPAPVEGVRYLLIDALDEALTQRAAGLTIVDLLASRLSRLPSWLRVVATTRKEPAVLDRLRGLRAQTIDAQDPRNRDDLARFLHRRLQLPNLTALLTVARLSPAQASGRLLDKSAGNFLYLKQVLAGLEQGDIDFARLEQLPPGLMGLYLRFFERHFPDAASYAGAREVLSVLVAAQEPLPREELAPIVRLDPGVSLGGVLRQISSFLRELSGPGGGVGLTLYHKSLADWLTDVSLDGSIHYVGLKQGNVRLADAGWKEYGQGISSMSMYMLRHLPLHLVESRRWDDLAALLTDLSYLESKAETGLLLALVGDLGLASRSIPSAYAEGHLLSLLEEALRRDLPFLLRHPETLFQTVWNLGWWYDCPEAELFWDPPEAGTPTIDPPWRRQGPKLCALLERWKKEKSQRVPGRCWLRSLRPPPIPIGSGLRIVLRGHNEMYQVHGVLFALDTGRLVSWSGDDSVRIWDVPSGTELGVLRHPASVNGVVFALNGRRLVSACGDKMLRIWDSNSGEELTRLSGHDELVECVALAPDGRHLASGSWDNTVRIWDADGGDEVAVLQGHGHQVRTVAFTPDGGRLASGSVDTDVRIWDANNGSAFMVLQGHRDTVNRVIFSPDGRCLASASADGTIRIWDPSSGLELAVLSGHSQDVTDIAFSPDGNCLASSSRDHTARIWDRDSWRERAVLCHDSSVASIAIAPDGSRLASASDEGVRIWDTHDGDQLVLLPHVMGVQSVSFSPDGRRLVSGSWGNLYIWELGAKREWVPRRSYEESAYRRTFAPDRSRFAICGKDNTVQIWDSETNTQITVLRGHGQEVTSMAFSSDGRRFATASNDFTIRYWDTDRGVELTVLRGHECKVSVLTFSSDGCRLASATDNGDLRIWNLDKDTEQYGARGIKGQVHAVAFSPNGQRIVIRGSSTVRAFDLGSGTELADIGPIGGMTAPYGMEDVAFAPDGRRIAIAVSDSTVRIWDVETCSELEVLRGHPSCVDKVAFGQGGHLLASLSEDGMVRIWETETYTCLHVMQGPADIEALLSGPPWVLLGGKEESVVHDVGGTPVAYFPVPMHAIVMFPSGTRWNAVSQGQAYLVQLDRFSP